MENKKGKINLTDFSQVVGQYVIDVILRLAEKFRNKKIKMVNSTLLGGGVAEILHNMVPLLNQIGVDTVWEVIKGSPEFFNITKKMHNALHGGKDEINSDMISLYLEYNEKNLNSMNFYEDYVIIHDPQPLVMVRKKKRTQGKWIWRCHVDVSAPNSVLWKFLKEYVEQYDASVFSAPSFSAELSIPQYMITPSINPFSDKNRELPKSFIEKVLLKYNIDKDKPIIAQISRYDRLKDPVGVIKAYKLTRKYVECQLVLVGAQASDDPEGADVLKEVQYAAGNDKDIHIINLPTEEMLEVNALQRAATIILQKSIREGFALTVTEALWKKKPVIASAVGGIPLQVINNFTGILVHSVEGAALKMRYLLENVDYAKKLGEQGYEHVKHNFLITRHITNYLLMLISLHYQDRRENIIML